MFSLTPKASIPTGENWKQTSLGLLAEVAGISLQRNPQVKNGARRSLFLIRILGKAFGGTSGKEGWRSVSEVCLISPFCPSHVCWLFLLKVIWDQVPQSLCIPPHVSVHNLGILHVENPNKENPFLSHFSKCQLKPPADDLTFTDAVNFKSQNKIPLYFFV